MNIDTLVKSFYSDKDETESLINEVMKFLLVEKAMPTSESFDWNAIPELPISELGWSDTRTRDAGGPQAGQRKLLEDYLNQIEGSTLSEKLTNLNEFMTNPDLASKSPGDKIAKILGYLVFYKTLTRVITNFNASSAGFSFESFLAVLTGGEQIATGQETIADYKSGDDYVSLKLYNEASVEVGGSFQDLVDDLVDDTKNNSMIYLVVLKNLQGDGLDQEGTLSFHQFKLNLDNVANFIAKSSKESRFMMALPLDKNGQLISLGEPEPDDLEEATQRVRTSSDQFVKDFNETLAAEVKAQLEKRIEQIPELAEVPDLGELANLIQLGGENFPKLTGDGVKQAHAAIKAAVAEIALQSPEVTKLFKQKAPRFIGKGSQRLDLAIGADFGNLLNGLLKKLKKDPEVSRKSGADTLLKSIRLDKASVDRSIEYYNSLAGNSEMQKKALFSSYGYLGAKKFGVGKSVATGKTAVDGMPVGDLGVLEIGASRIVPILEEARGELNDQVFGIFSNLKILSTQINAYFASGLQDEKAGATASQASKDIATDTEEVVSTSASDTDSRDPAAGLGGAKQWEE
jgi:hypothetical protein